MRIHAHAVSALCLLALGCRSTSFGEVDGTNARTHLEQVEEEIRSGAYARALEHLTLVLAIDELDPDLRAREQRLIDAAARGRFAELAEASPDELEELYLSELPARIRARAGILMAERLLADEQRITAFRQIKKVDEAIPGHPERVLAGDVLARAGLALIRDPRRYNLIFHYEPRGVQALEYLVLQCPLEPRCAEAYFALSESYERAGDLDEAISRSEALLLYHPESPYAVAASARLPYLRLCRLGRDDYDRGELLRARGELVAWLGRNPAHELAPWVREIQHECLARLVRSDLYLARFYRRTASLAGQRLHAERAQALALEAGLVGEAESARLLLADLPPAESPPPASTPSVP